MPSKFINESKWISKENSPWKITDVSGITTSSGVKNSQYNAGYVRKRVPSVGIKPVIGRLPEKPFLNQYIILDGLRGSGVFPIDGGRKYWIAGSIAPVAIGDVLLSVRYPLTGKVDYESVWDVPYNLDYEGQSISKALNKLKEFSFGDGQDVDWGVFWGERRESARLLRDATVGTLNLARSIARKDVSGFVRELQDCFGVSTSVRQEAARMKRVERNLRRSLRRAPRTAERVTSGMNNAYLAYNLGVSPLLSDLDRTLRRLSLPETIAASWIKVKGRHSVVKQGEDSQNIADSVLAEAKGFYLHGYTTTVVCGLYDRDLAKLAAMGLRNPVNLLYQLTSLTFVIDHWVAIGDWLSSLDAISGFKFIDGSITHRVRVSNSCSFTTSEGVISGNYRVDHTERRVLNTFPFPMPPMSRRSPDLTAKQMLTEFSLAYARLRSLVM